ncbi:MAG: pyridoxal phosphate-dependent aminotransferase [Acidobacteriota bacterium]
MKISKRGESIQESPIRKLSAVAAQTKKKGTKVYHLNIGQPDIPTPEVFYDAIRTFSEKVLSYGPSDGIIELKEAMINYFNRYEIDLEPENITITYGGSEAVYFAFNVVGDPGDEIIIPEPFYTNYNGYATMSNLNIVPIPTDAESGFHLPDISEIEKKINPRTKAILICSPNNPTGTIFSEEEIRKIGDLAKKHNLFIIADEVYKEFTYDGSKHFSVLEMEDVRDRVIVVDSISKRYSSCGARVGALISRNKDVMGSVLKFAQARLCPPTLEQLGAAATYALPQSYFKDIKSEYQKRRDVLYEILTENKEIVLRKPEGAFYLMAGLPVDDSDKFAKWMLESFNVDNETVMIAPGGGFYSTEGKGKQEVRIAYVLEEEKLIKAGKILLKAIDEYNRLKQ